MLGVAHRWQVQDALELSDGSIDQIVAAICNLAYIDAFKPSDVLRQLLQLHPLVEHDDLLLARVSAYINFLELRWEELYTTSVLEVALHEQAGTLVRSDAESLRIADQGKDPDTSSINENISEGQSGNVGCNAIRRKPLRHSWFPAGLMGSIPRRVVMFDLSKETCLCASEDGQILVVTDGLALFVCDSTCQPLQTWLLPDCVVSLKFAVDEQAVLCIGDDEFGWIQDIRTGECVRELDAVSDATLYTYLSQETTTVQTWSTLSLQKIGQPLTPGGEVTTLCFDRASSFVVVGTDEVLGVWRRCLPENHPPDSSDIRLEPRENVSVASLLGVSSWTPGCLTVPKFNETVNDEGWVLFWRIRLSSRRHVQRAWISHDGTRVCIYMREEEYDATWIECYDTMRATLLGQVRYMGLSVDNVVFGPAEQIFLIVGGELHYWDLDSSITVDLLKDSVSLLAYEPSHARLFCWIRNALHVWEGPPCQWSAIDMLGEQCSSFITDVIWSRSGDTVATAEQHALRIFDSYTGTLIAEKHLLPTFIRALGSMPHCQDIQVAFQYSGELSFWDMVNTGHSHLVETVVPAKFYVSSCEHSLSEFVAVAAGDFEDTPHRREIPGVPSEICGTCADADAAAKAAGRPSDGGDGVMGDGADGATGSRADCRMSDVVGSTSNGTDGDAADSVMGEAADSPACDADTAMSDTTEVESDRRPGQITLWCYDYCTKQTHRVKLPQVAIPMVVVGDALPAGGRVLRELGTEDQIRSVLHERFGELPEQWFEAIRPCEVGFEGKVRKVTAHPLASAALVVRKVPVSGLLPNVYNQIALISLYEPTVFWHTFIADDIIDAAFTPDGSFLALLLDDSIQIIDLHTPDPARAIEANPLPCLGFRLAFSPDGKYIAVSDSLNNVQIRNPARLLSGPVMLLRGCMEDVTAVRWRRDSKAISAGTVRGITHVWELPSLPSTPRPPDAALDRRDREVAMLAYRARASRRKLCFRLASAHWVPPAGCEYRACPLTPLCGLGAEEGVGDGGIPVDSSSSAGTPVQPGVVADESLLTVYERICKDLCARNL
eukprot:Rmarinus@m.11223